MDPQEWISWIEYRWRLLYTSAMPSAEPCPPIIASIAKKRNTSLYSRYIGKLIDLGNCFSAPSRLHVCTVKKSRHRILNQLRFLLYYWFCGQVLYCVYGGSKYSSELLLELTEERSLHWAKASSVRSYPTHIFGSNWIWECHAFARRDLRQGRRAENDSSV